MGKTTKILITLEQLELDYLEEIRKDRGFRSRSVTVGQVIRGYYQMLQAADLTTDNEEDMSNHIY